MKKVICFIIALVLCASCVLPAFAKETNPNDILTDSQVCLSANGDGTYEITPTNIRTWFTRSVPYFYATKVIDGVYESSGKYFVQVTGSKLAEATKVHVNILDNSAITEAVARYDISEEITNTLTTISAAATAQFVDNTMSALTDGVDLYLSSTWVRGYQNREYRSEYLNFRNSTEWKTIRTGFNTSVLESALTMLIDFCNSGVGTSLTVYQILRDAFYDPTITGGTTKRLQFAGDWGIVLVYTYIKAINSAEGAIGDALLRSIESVVEFNHVKFNVYTPGGNPANVETDSRSVGPLYSPNYNNTTGRQQICYNHRYDTTVVDETPETLVISVGGFTARVNITSGMRAA